MVLNLAPRRLTQLDERKDGFLVLVNFFGLGLPFSPVIGVIRRHELSDVCIRDWNWHHWLFIFFAEFRRRPPSTTSLVVDGAMLTQ